MPGSPTVRRTRVFDLTRKGSAARAISAAGAVLRSGGLVAFPTETVYGLGANALNAKAVRGIFRAKGRPTDNPLIVHLRDAGDLPRVARDIPALGLRLAEAFWPGPLTLVLPKHPRVPKVTTAGLDTVAVRVPSLPWARRLIEAAGVPIAAPSANLSGRPSLTTPGHLVRELKGKVDILLLGGKSRIGVESTVVDVVSSPPVLLRAGGLSVERLQSLVPDLRVLPLEASGAPDRETPPRSPGLKYRHYAPRARVTLFVGSPQRTRQALENRRRMLTREGRKVGLLVTRESGLRGPAVRVLGSRRAPDRFAFGLFHALRELDALGADEILVEGIPATGVGLAVMDRLRRAAGDRVVDLRVGPVVSGRGRAVAQVSQKARAIPPKGVRTPETHRPRKRPR